MFLYDHYIYANSGRLVCSWLSNNFCLIMHDCVNNSSQWMNIMWMKYYYLWMIVRFWFCYYDQVMYGSGWLAVWLHAFISSCYFMFNHLYICNWVWEFAFGSVVWCNVVWLRVMYVKQYREVLAKAFFATSCQAITFMPWFIMICYVAPLSLVVCFDFCA